MQKYRRKGILIDTNLLIGLLVGILDPSYLRNCRATKAFTHDDFVLLRRFVEQFETVITTPHILTEVSNLAGRLPENLVADFRTIFRVAIEKWVEKEVPALNIVRDSGFLRLGLTDTAIAMTVPGRFLVLTDELQLYHVLYERKIDVINFNHIRSLGWE
jgi:hypothetical protein